MKAIKKLLAMTMAFVTFSMNASTPVKVSPSDYKEARQVAKNYVNAALCGDYESMIINQSMGITAEIKERGGEMYVRGVQSGDIYEMREALGNGYWPMETEWTAAIMDNDQWADIGAPNGVIVIRFYFEMRKGENNKTIAPGNSNIKIDLIQEDGKWVVLRAK